LAQTWSESMLETMYTVLPFPLLTQTQGAFAARRWVVLDRGGVLGIEAMLMVD
jgi:hypothetical protein